jgi:hypothetical protein
VGTNEAPALAADSSPTSTLDAPGDAEAAMAEAVAPADIGAVAPADIGAVAPADIRAVPLADIRAVPLADGFVAFAATSGVDVAPAEACWGAVEPETLSATR